LGERIDAMNDNTADIELGSEDILTLEVTDEELEVAASTTTGEAFTFAGAPTVSVLFACCSNDDTGELD
jgi:hypothetical protein